jgi:hypothetical protein
MQHGDVTFQRYAPQVPVALLLGFFLERLQRFVSGLLSFQRSRPFPVQSEAIGETLKQSIIKSGEFVMKPGVNGQGPDSIAPGYQGIARA